MNSNSPKTPDKRIAFFCDQTVEIHFPAHFSEVYLKILPKLGWDVILWAFALNPDSLYASELKRMGKVRLCPKKPGNIFNRLALAFKIPFMMHKWYREMNLRNADVLVVHNDPIIGLIAWIWSKKSKAALIFRVTHLIPESIAYMGGWYHKIIAFIAIFIRDWVMRRCDAVLPTSKEMARKLYRDNGISKNKLHPFVATVNTTIKDFEEDKRCINFYNQIAYKLSQCFCDYWTVYVGTLDPQRQPKFLIDTLVELRSMDVNAGLLVLGVTRFSSQLKKLKQYAINKNVEKYIVWAEPIPDHCIPMALKLVDVGLCPFPIDPILCTNSPLKTLEYIRSGIPVVATPIPDSIEVINKSHAGKIAKHDPYSFALAVYKLILEKSFYKKDKMKNAMFWLKTNRDLNVASHRLNKIAKSVIKIKNNKN